ncbi:MAG: hypothetical protein IPN76_07445 [Saprospiraceae bacterium]|nr:hypothetical protein [Saprospiraceae bacterium]
MAVLLDPAGMVVGGGFRDGGECVAGQQPMVAGAGEGVVGPVVGEGVVVVAARVVVGVAGADPPVGIIGEVGGDEVVVAVEYPDLTLPDLALIDVLYWQVVGGAGEGVRAGDGEGGRVGPCGEARGKYPAVQVVLGAEPLACASRLPSCARAGRSRLLYFIVMGAASGTSLVSMLLAWS